MTSESVNFSLQDKKELLKIARTSIEVYLCTSRVPVFDDKDFSSSLKMHAGAFVTLHREGQLRGCIGRFGADCPLYEVVRDMAIAAATEDNRFMPVTLPELEKIDIEISVLTPMKKINSVEEIELGKHGIYIRKGGRGGTFLPQVATETGWTLEEFLGHCSRDKAGLGWDGWKNAEILTYEAIVFGEKSLN